MRRGQAAAEYVLVFAGIVLVVVSVFRLLVGEKDRPGVIERFGERTKALVTSDCP